MCQSESKVSVEKKKKKKKFKASIQQKEIEKLN